MTSSSDICSLSAGIVAEEIRARRLSAVEVTQAALERMESLEPTLHAFCTPTPEQALTEARRVDAMLASGRDVGVLAGVPVAIKDLICTRGIKTASGCVAYEGFVPDEDDVAVARLRSADAIILGKTNVSELGYSGIGENPLFPTTCNPWDPLLTSGGSSAGSGAAVAAGMAPLALGSDGGGSIRIPASFCSLFGMKPSMGRVPLYPGTRDERFPGMSSWESVEHIGPMSRSVQDGALMLSVIAGPDERDRHSLPSVDFDWHESTRGELPRLRIAYSADLGYTAVDPAVRSIVAEAVLVFDRDLGCLVEEVVPDWPDPYEAFMAVVASESDLRGLRALVDRVGADRMSPHLVDFINQQWTAEEFTDALMVRKALKNRMSRLMRDYDLLVTPTLAVPPFELGIRGPATIDGRPVRENEWHNFTFPVNLTGQPAASVPAGWADGDRPVGMQIIGRHLADRLVLRASAAFEAAAPWISHQPRTVRDLAAGARPPGS